MTETVFRDSLCGSFLSVEFVHRPADPKGRMYLQPQCSAVVIRSGQTLSVWNLIKGEKIGQTEIETSENDLRVVMRPNPEPLIVLGSPVQRIPMSKGWLEYWFLNSGFRGRIELGYPVSPLHFCGRNLVIQSDKSVHFCPMLESNLSSSMKHDELFTDGRHAIEDISLVLPFDDNLILDVDWRVKDEVRLLDTHLRSCVSRLKRKGPMNQVRAASACPPPCSAPSLPSSSSFSSSSSSVISYQSESESPQRLLAVEMYSESVQIWDVSKMDPFCRYILPENATDIHKVDLWDSNTAVFIAGKRLLFYDLLKWTELAKFPLNFIPREESIKCLRVDRKQRRLFVLTYDNRAVYSLHPNLTWSKFESLVLSWVGICGLGDYFPLDLLRLLHVFVEV